MLLLSLLIRSFIAASIFDFFLKPYCLKKIMAKFFFTENCLAFRQIDV